MKTAAFPAFGWCEGVANGREIDLAHSDNKKPTTPGNKRRALFSAVTDDRHYLQNVFRQVFPIQPASSGRNIAWMIHKEKISVNITQKSFRAAKKEVRSYKKMK